jgi:hypothetical protein
MITSDIYNKATSSGPIAALDANPQASYLTPTPSIVPSSFPKLWAIPTFSCGLPCAFQIENPIRSSSLMPCGPEAK